MENGLIIPTVKYAEGFYVQHTTRPWYLEGRHECEIAAHVIIIRVLPPSMFKF